MSFHSPPSQPFPTSPTPASPSDTEDETPPSCAAGACASATPTSTARWGLLLCVSSTTFYCIANIILRGLADAPVPHTWTLFYKELIAFVFLAPWLVCRFLQGRYDHQSKRLLAYIVIGGIACQLVGARLQLWAFGVIGIILAMPIIQAFNLVSTAVLGTYIAGDHLSSRKKWMIMLLVVALAILTWGKMRTTSETAVSEGVVPPTTVTAAIEPTPVVAVAVAIVAPKTTQWLTLLGVAAAITTGLAYAFHMTCLRIACSRYWRADYRLRDNLRWNDWIGIRYQTQRAVHERPSGEPVSLILAMEIVLGIGVVGFGGCLYWEHGVSGFTEASPMCWWLVGATGACNLIGFFFQVFALRLTSATQVMLISVLQIGILALTGYFLFAEPVNALIILGLVLTTVGVAASMEETSSKQRPQL